MENEYMRLALNEAALAEASGDIPVGAVIVKNGVVIAKAHNTREKYMNALCHAEISAINSACRYLNNWRLDDCDMYVTLEPCIMCSGAVVQSRIRRVFFGAYDIENGYMASNFVPGLKLPECYCGIMEEECDKILKEYFKELRDDN